MLSNLYLQLVRLSTKKVHNLQVLRSTVLLPRYLWPVDYVLQTHALVDRSGRPGRKRP